MLEQPEVKIATRNMFYDEQGKHRRTKKAVLDEQGNLRAGCSIIPKGEVYESHIFTKKDEWFKNKAFTKEVKELFTDTINRYVKEESEKLSVFQQGGVYLATKKIGKNNPKAEEIKADNAARQEWNRTVDVALVEGVPEEDILKIKQEKITDKTLQSIRTCEIPEAMVSSGQSGRKDHQPDYHFHREHGSCGSTYLSVFLNYRNKNKNHY